MNLSITLSWIGGIVSGAVALFVFVDQITFDAELLTTEKRLVEANDLSDQHVLKELMTTQRIIVAQQQQQFLTLRRDLLIEQIARMHSQYNDATPKDQAILTERLRQSEARLGTMEQQLEKLLLHPKSRVEEKFKGIEDIFQDYP